MQNIVIFWFRQDLRLADNPGLIQAASQGTVLPIYILDDVNSKQHALGAASKVWLHGSLKSLNSDLPLNIYKGNPLDIIQDLAKRYKISAIYWNRCYEPWRIKRDKKIKSWCSENDIIVDSFNASLLWEPWQVLKSDGTPYKVFTPFYKKGCLNSVSPRRPEPKVTKINAVKDEASLQIEQLELLPKIDWQLPIQQYWDMGEKAALERLDTFLEQGIDNYKQGRNFPGLKKVSRLSPYLHFGEISPNTVWYGVADKFSSIDSEHFLSELAWREFSYNLLYHFPELPTKNLQEKFNKFPWNSNKNNIKAWQQGRTGYPIVDAGMRELWETGYMHNRVRMIVGSFLVKNLLLHWHHGEHWFWDCLVDADLANNSASWQWIAGCGADAAPYFRIFNPITQGQKFDPQGEYTRKYLPQLKDIPDKYLFSPWEAPTEVLEQAGIKLGKDYPKPIVDLKPSREQALAAFSELSS